MPYILLFGFVMFIFSSHLFAAGTDYLSGASDDAASSFGEGSTFEKFLYLGEAIVGAYAYIKTKNIMVLAGVIVLMIFTHFFFGSILTTA